LIETEATVLVESPTSAHEAAAKAAWTSGKAVKILQPGGTWYRVVGGANEAEARVRAVSLFASNQLSRFSPIKDPAGEICPCAYAADVDRVALWETVLRNARHAGIKRVASREIRGRYLFRLAVAYPQKLIDLSRPANLFTALPGSRPPDLSAAWPKDYLKTGQWAQMFMTQLEDADGIFYESHQIAGHCMTLYGTKKDLSRFEILECLGPVGSGVVRKILLTEADRAGLAIDFDGLEDLLYPGDPPI
jgi:hypothetical protein